MRLNLEQKGAYSCVLDLIYDNGGPIPDNPQWIARVCGCSVRKWKIIKEELIGLGKLYLVDGKIANQRADKQTLSEEKEAQKLSENGMKGAEKTNVKKPVLHEINK